MMLDCKFISLHQIFFLNTRKASDEGIDYDRILAISLDRRTWNCTESNWDGVYVTGYDRSEKLTILYHSIRLAFLSIQRFNG